MAQAKKGDTVKVHYTGKLVNGAQFDSSVDSEPLEFTIGQGQLIAGFEQAVIGMTPGDSKTAEIGADEAYGARNDELILRVDREEFPDHISPTKGQQLRMQQDDRVFTVMVTEVSDSEVTLDANHPLAGQDLIFDIELVEIA